MPTRARRRLRRGEIPPADHAAIAARPDIVALDRAIDEAVARERLARAMRTPDPTVSGGVLVRRAAGIPIGWRAGLAITLPVFTRHDAGVRVETARVAQLRAQREARIADLTGEAPAAAARAQAARQPYLRYRDEIIPQLATIESLAETRIGRARRASRRFCRRCNRRAKCGCVRPKRASSIRRRWRISSARSEDRSMTHVAVLDSSWPRSLLSGCHAAAPTRP